MKKTLIALLSLLPLLASAANLLTNGSFENGLVGWQEVPGNLARPATTIAYDSIGRYPNGAGESIPADDAAGSVAYVATGLRAAYFVDDAADPETLTQTVDLHAGVKYTFGFDIYIPADGDANGGDSNFSATIGGFEFASVDASAGPTRQWVHYQAYGIAAADGDADFVLSFSSGPGPARDFLVDDVFFATADADAPPNSPGMTTTPVPEPGSWAMLAMGLAILAVARVRSGMPIALCRHARNTRSLGPRHTHR